MSASVFAVVKGITQLPAQLSLLPTLTAGWLVTSQVGVWSDIGAIDGTMRAFRFSLCSQSILQPFSGKSHQFIDDFPFAPHQVRFGQWWAQFRGNLGLTGTPLQTLLVFINSAILWNSLIPALGGR